MCCDKDAGPALPYLSTPPSLAKCPPLGSRDYEKDAKYFFSYLRGSVPSTFYQELGKLFLERAKIS